MSRASAILESMTDRSVSGYAAGDVVKVKGKSLTLLRRADRNGMERWMTTNAGFFYVGDEDLKEGYHEPSEDELKQFKRAAAKMIDHIKKKSPDFDDSDGSVAQAFEDNMRKLTRGEFK